jgi:hypothetical protein
MRGLVLLLPSMKSFSVHQQAMCYGSLFSGHPPCYTRHPALTVLTDQQQQRQQQQQ